jgi:hypothetical protein
MLLLLLLLLLLSPGCSQVLTALDRADDLVGFRHGDLRVR